MNITQFVMAYGAEQDRLRALLPEGFTSLRPVRRINAELRGTAAWLEFVTAAEYGGRRGWFRLGCWESVPFRTDGKTVVFCPDFLEISFTGTGIEGGCPAEKDNAGCFLPDGSLRAPDRITEKKEFCDCRFRWRFSPDDAHGVSIGKTLPAYPSEVRTVYPKQAPTPQNAAAIPCTGVLGAYLVRFSRP